MNVVDLKTIGISRSRVTLYPVTLLYGFSGGIMFLSSTTNEGWTIRRNFGGDTTTNYCLIMSWDEAIRKGKHFDA